jgi:hypothetical protein
MRRALLTTLILLAALVSSAAAVTVTYTVGGTGPMQFPAATTPPAGSPWGPSGYPGDTVLLEAYTGTLDLSPGTYILKINTLQWTIDYTYGGTETCWDYLECWSELSFPVSAPRSITVHTSNGTLAQTGLLECLWDNDYLALAGGSPVGFSISGVSVQVTPLPFDRTAAFWGKPSPLATQPPREIQCDIPCVQPPRDLFAEFVVDGIIAVEETTWMQVKNLYK